MASVTLQVRDVFPPGTSVGAYKRTGWASVTVPTRGTAPTGSADTTATVAADGTLAFTGLTANTDYVAGAQISGTWTFLNFRAESDAENAKVIDTTVAWANSATANTQKTVDLPAFGGDTDVRNDLLLVIVRNPSSVTAVAGTANAKYLDPADSSTTRYAKVTSFTAAAANGDGEAFLIQGATLGQGGRLILQNATVLGGSDGFTASVQAWRQ